MKWYVILALFCVNCLNVFGEIPEKEMKRLKRMVKINSVQDATIRNEDREKIAVLKLGTAQDEMDKEGFRMRITMELTDKSKNSYYAQLLRRQGNVDTEYAGEDRWEFHVPHGELERPKVTAYAVEYGIMDDETFVPIATKFDDVDSAEELVERCTSEIKAGVKMKHSYVYRNGDEGETDSLMRTLKK